MTIDLPLVALGGVLGSSHCVGMCGAFVLTIGLGSRSPSQNAARQIAYGSGRIFTYGFLGSVAGFAGFWFQRRSGPLIHAQAALSIVAGLLLIVQGLITLRILPVPLAKALRHGSGASCLASSFAGPLLRSPRGSHVFVAGMLNGLLPCGLVYGYLALATSTASVPQGMATMAAFGAGTLPLMVLTGLGSSLLSFSARKHLFQVAGVCVLLTGFLAVNRGLAAWWPGDASCCVSGETSPTP